MHDGDHALIWTPPADAWERSNIGRFAQWLRATRGLAFDDYDALWTWSVAQPAAFWSAVWERFGIVSATPFERVLEAEGVADARWFGGATLNFAEHVLRSEITGPALVGVSQTRGRVEWTMDELRGEVARCRAGLARLGVKEGDRVVAYLPNIPEAIAAFLATASLGGIWSSCPPEFGIRSVIDRFRQIEPKVLLVVDGYRFGDRAMSVLDRVRTIRASLPSLRATVLLPYLDANATADWDGVSWRDFTRETQPLAFARVAFDHPLYILYSSGTTGLPKAIVHGHGGILLEHHKLLSLQLDLRPGDRFFWFSTTGWMMWNLLLSGLLVQASVVTFDGNLAWPSLDTLWALAEDERITYFGVSASFLLACRNASLDVQRHAYPALRSVGSTGSPLAPATARWIRAQLPREVQIGSGSGGTDVCGAFVGAVPVKPVFADEIAARCLGAKVEAYDAQGRSVIETMGELVITAPMPSMPVGFWGDADRSRYRDAYFGTFPGVWRHGDWITIHESGGCTIHGRSDATLNRGGVRLGTAEFYAVVESLPGVADSLVVHCDDAHGGPGDLVLFVVAKEGQPADDAFAAAITNAIRRELSPRHVPDAVHFVPAVPRTLTGKKLEVPVKRILAGASVASVATEGALANPAALAAFEAFARQR
jgi:acetoacetyl-CoA synthetase